MSKNTNTNEPVSHAQILRDSAQILTRTMYEELSKAEHHARNGRGYYAARAYGRAWRARDLAAESLRLATER